MKLFTTTIDPLEEIILPEVNTEAITLPIVSPESIECCEDNEESTFIVKEYDTDGIMSAQVYILGEVKKVSQILELLETAKEDDTILFHLSEYKSYGSDNMALMSSITACKGTITTYGHYLNSLESICIWAVGHERIVSPFSMFTIQSLSSMTWGPLGILKDSIEECARMDILLMNLLLKVGLVTQEEIDKMRISKSQLLLFGEELMKRV